MFDLAERRLVWIPIVWKGLKQASPDALAEPCEYQIEVLTEIVERERLQEIFGGPPEDDDSPEEKARKEKGNATGQIERFRALVSDWRKVKAGASEAPFTDENIDRLLKVPNFALGFDTSYLRAWSGQIELAQKNSEDSSGSGQPDEEKPSATAKKPNARKRSK